MLFYFTSTHLADHSIVKKDQMVGFETAAVLCRVAGILKGGDSIFPLNIK